MEEYDIVPALAQKHHTMHGLIHNYTIGHIFYFMYINIDDAFLHQKFKEDPRKQLYFTYDYFTYDFSYEFKKVFLEITLLYQ